MDVPSIKRCWRAMKSASRDARASPNTSSDPVAAKLAGLVNIDGSRTASADGTNALDENRKT